MLNISGRGAPLRTHVNSTSVADDKPIHLVLVDDDDDFREAASAELEDLGFEVTSFPDGPALLAAIANGTKADVLVLDWNMPAMNGMDLLRQLRQSGQKFPAVFLTGRSTPTLEGEALDVGALDFVDKTRGLPILAKRVRRIVEAARQPATKEVAETFRCGPLQLNSRTSRAFWNDNDLGLTLTEFKVVRLLATNAGDYVTYRAVYDCVHHAGFIAGQGENGYRGNVRSTIKRIRIKLRTVDPEADWIKNYPSFGYRWETPQHA